MGEPLNPRYKTYHPKWYRSRIPIFWWLRKYAYAKFISRELTSIAVAYSALLLLVQVWTLSRGEAAYDRFLAVLQARPVVYFHIFIFLVLVFHAVTWLNLAPSALVVRIGGRRIPDALVLVGHYFAWLVASGALVWLLVLR